MNISLLVYDIGLTGGAEKVAEQLSIQFSGYHNVTLVSLFDSQKKCGKKDYKCRVISSKHRSITRSFVPITRRLRRFLKEDDTDILIAVTAGVVTVAVAAVIGTDTRVIYAEHSNLENRTYGKKHQLRQRVGAVCSNMVVTLTERDKENFCRKYKVSEDKVICIPNWYIPVNYNNAYDLNSKLIITAGRLEYVKGYHYLMDVAKMIYPRCDGWKWHIYGDGSLRTSLEEEIANSGLGAFIEMKGNVTNLPELYPNYSMYVMTSVYEGFPLVLLEAQAAGLPIISFDCPTGPAEIVDSGTNGIIVPAYDTQALGEAIIALISNQEMRCSMAAKAKDNIGRYSIDKILVQWLELFDKIIK